MSSPSSTHKAKSILAFQIDQRAEQCICWIQFFFLYACGFQTLTEQREVVVAQSLSCVLLFETPWTAARQASLPFTIFQNLLKLMSIELVMPFNHPILCCPLLLLPHQAPLFMKFSRQEYWGGWLFPSPGDLPDTGIEPGSPTLQADCLPSEPPGKPQELRGPNH